MKKILQSILLVCLFVLSTAYNASATFTAGSTVTTSVANYCPSTSSQTINFPITVSVSSPDAEYIDFVSVTAPAGISIAHLTPLNPAPGTVSCASGDGEYFGVGTQTVSWAISATSFVTPSGCGFWELLGSITSKTYTVALTIPANYNSPIAIGYNVNGDGWQCTGACNCGIRSCLSGSFTINPFTVTASVSAPNICLGSSTTFTGGGASTYTWSDGTNTPTDATAFTPLTTGTSTYTVTGTDANLCSATSTVTLTVNALPTITASVSAPNICLGSSATFTGGGASTYTWSDGTNTPTDAVAFTPLVGGTSTYTVTGTDASMCSATSSVSLTINSLPISSLTTSGNNFCTTGNATLNTTPLLAAPPTYCNSAFTNATYESISNVSYGVINNTSFGNTGGPVNYTAQVANVTVGIPTNLSVTIVPDFNEYINAWIDWNKNGILNDVGEVYTIASGVSTAGPYNLSITPPATAINGNTRMRVMLNYSNSTPNPCNSSTYGEAEDYTVNVTGGVAPSAGYSTIAWSPATFLNVTDTTQVIATAVNTTTTYTVTGTDANGCTATSSITLTVNPLPTVNATSIPSPAIVCAGSSVTLSGSGTATSYAWTGGVVDGTSFVPSATAVYTVTGTDANLCSATSSVTVNVTQPATFNAPTTLLTSCPTNDGGSVIVSASSASTFVISPSASQPASGVFTSMVGGTNYVVTLTDANLCTNTISISATSVSNGELANAAATNASSIAGNSCGILTQTDSSTFNYYGASCDDLIATIVDASGGNVLGSVNACVTVLPTVPTFNSQPYLPRYYDITPTNQGPATITLYFTQDDFDDYNAAAGSFPQIPAVQAIGTATFCISQVPAGFLPGASGATTIVHTVTATWNAGLSRWEVVLPVNSFSGFYCHACNPLNSALPAAITNFKGTKTETTDLLTWSTTSELNNASFTILYSTDGKNFNRLTSVNSKATSGNSNVVLNYSAENSMPKFGHNYYKLEQVDIDGKSLVNTQVVDLMWGANGSTISVYPNPTSNDLNIDIFTHQTENSTIKVLDMSGRILREVQSKLQAGANNIQLNISDLTSGIYTVQILENNKITQVSKVEKQ